jgi:hypothetical protein
MGCRHAESTTPLFARPKVTSNPRHATFQLLYLHCTSSPTVNLQHQYKMSFSILWPNFSSHVICSVVSILLFSSWPTPCDEGHKSDCTPRVLLNHAGFRRRSVSPLSQPQAFILPSTACWRMCVSGLCASSPQRPIKNYVSSTGSGPLQGCCCSGILGETESINAASNTLRALSRVAHHRPRLCQDLELNLELSTRLHIRSVRF